MIEIILPPDSEFVVWGVALLAGLGLIGVLWFVVRRWLRRGLHDARDRNRMRAEWGTIATMRDSNDPHQLQLAVVRADRLLDQLLKSMMMPGSTLGERLKVAQSRYPELKDVWWAHKVRNSIVHDSSEHAARRLHGALNEFEKAFKKLGIL